MILLNVYCLLLLAQCGITSDKASGHVESTRNNKITLLTEEVFVHGDFITDQDKGVKSSSSVNHNQVIVDIGDLESQNEAGTLKLVLYRRRNPFLAFIIGHRKMSDQLITWKYDDDEDRQETCFRVKPVAYNRIKKLLNSVKSVLQKTLQKFKIGWNIPDKKSEEDKEGDAELEKGMKDKKLYRCRFDMSGFKRIQEGRYFFKIRRKSNDEYIGQSSDFYIINARKKHVDPKSSILKSVAVDAKHFFFQFKRKPDRDEKLYYTIYQYNLKSNVHTPLYRHLIDSRFVFTKEKHMDSEYTYKIKIKNAEMIDYEDEYVQLVLKGEMYSPLNNTYAQLDLVKIYCCGEKHFLTSTTRLFRSPVITRVNTNDMELFKLKLRAKWKENQNKLATSIAFGVGVKLLAMFVSSFKAVGTIGAAVAAKGAFVSGMAAAAPWIIIGMAVVVPVTSFLLNVYFSAEYGFLYLWKDF